MSSELDILLAMYFLDYVHMVQQMDTIGIHLESLEQALPAIRDPQTSLSGMGA